MKLLNHSEKYFGLSMKSLGFCVETQMATFCLLSTRPPKKNISATYQSYLFKGFSGFYSTFFRLIFKLKLMSNFIHLLSLDHSFPPPEDTGSVYSFLLHFCCNRQITTQFICFLLENSVDDPFEF